jgi:hypothetical protein
MARKSTFAEDLALLAADERSRLGEPPTAEELIACRDGKLTEEAGERVRDRLAVDPELASIYLDLTSDPAALAADAPADADGADAWRRLSPRLERAAVVPIRRRTAARVPLALAASLIMALGVGWLLTRPEPLPAGEYYPIEVTGAEYRGAAVTVPRDVAGVAFHVDASQLTGRIVVELRDSSDVLVRGETFPAGKIVFRVPANKIADQVYRLTVRPFGTPEGAPASIEEVFPLEFGGDS